MVHDTVGLACEKPRERAAHHLAHRQAKMYRDTQAALRSLLLWYSWELKFHPEYREVPWLEEFSTLLTQEPSSICTSNKFGEFGTH